MKTQGMPQNRGPINYLLARAPNQAYRELMKIGRDIEKDYRELLILITVTSEQTGVCLGPKE